MKKWEDKLDKIFEDNMTGYCSQIGGAEEIQIKELIEQELDKAREEVIKDLIKKIEEAHCDSISLELLKEIDLSKLKQ